MLTFKGIQSVLSTKYNIKLYDWDNDWLARKGTLMGKVAYDDRPPNDSILKRPNLVGDEFRDEDVAELFADMADQFKGNVVSMRGVSTDGSISREPFLFILKKN